LLQGSLPTAFLYGVLGSTPPVEPLDVTMNASHMDAPTVPMTGLAPQRIACCGVLRFAAGGVCPRFSPTLAEGTWSLIPGDSRAYRAARHGSRFLRTRRTSSRGRFWRLINADGTAVSVLLRGVCPKKLSHFALHIQICCTEPRGMVQDSYTRHTMLERTLLAPKKRRCESVSVLVSVGLPRVELAASYLGCTPPAEPLGTVQMRLV
jgi:hypothetical protein